MTDSDNNRMMHTTGNATDALESLMQIFPNKEKESLQALLIACNNNVDECTQYLLDADNKQEAYVVQDKFAQEMQDEEYARQLAEHESNVAHERYGSDGFHHVEDEPWNIKEKMQELSQKGKDLLNRMRGKGNP